MRQAVSILGGISTATFALQSEGPSQKTRVTCNGRRQRKFFSRASYLRGQTNCTLAKSERPKSKWLYVHAQPAHHWHVLDFLFHTPCIFDTDKTRHSEYIPTVVRLHAYAPVCPNELGVMHSMGLTAWYINTRYVIMTGLKAEGKGYHRTCCLHKSSMSKLPVSFDKWHQNPQDISNKRQEFCSICNKVGGYCQHICRLNIYAQKCSPI